MTRRLDSPGALLAALPSLLGRDIDDSIVVIGIGPGGHIAPILRADRSCCANPAGAAAFAQYAAAALSRTGALRAALAVFSEASGADEAALLTECLHQHVEVADAWIVARGRYRSTMCDDAGCCPADGTPLPPVPDLNGSSYERVAMGDRDLAPAARRRSAAGARRRAIAASRRNGVLWRTQALELWQAAVEDARGGVLPSDPVVGRLAAALGDVVVRDAVVVDLVPGEQELARALCVDPHSSGVSQALDRIIGTECPAHPDVDAITATIALAEHVAWLSHSAAAPALTIIGIAQWWSGDMHAAATAIDGALAAQEGYRLAELIACALAVDMLPGWLRAA